jgi:hypothetical protein
MYTRHASVNRAQRHGVARQDPTEDLRLAASVKRSPGREHLVEDDAKAPEIAPCIRGLTASLLRRHVADRSEDCAYDRLCLGRVCRARIREWPYETSQPEVQHLHTAIRPQHDIRWLEIAVDDSSLVRCGQRVGDEPSDPRRVHHRERTSAHPFRQRLSLDELGCDKRPALPLAHFVHSHDIGVIQRSRGTRLSLETTDAFGIALKLCW